MNSLFFWSTVMSAVMSAVSLGFLLGRANANIGRKKMEEEFDVKKENFKKEKAQLDNEIIRLNSIVVSTQIDRHKSFKDLKTNEIFICADFGGYLGDNKIFYRAVTQTPANKLQIVKVEKSGKIIGCVDKYITDTMEEMICLISECPEYFRKLDS